MNSSRGAEYGILWIDIVGVIYLQELKDSLLSHIILGKHYISQEGIHSGWQVIPHNKNWKLKRRSGDSYQLFSHWPERQLDRIETRAVLISPISIAPTVFLRTPSFTSCILAALIESPEGHHNVVFPSKI